LGIVAAAAAAEGTAGAGTGAAVGSVEVTGAVSDLVAVTADSEEEEEEEVMVVSGVAAEVVSEDAMISGVVVVDSGKCFILRNSFPFF
jgi:predicted methyltransferase